MKVFSCKKQGCFFLLNGLWFGFQTEVGNEDVYIYIYLFINLYLYCLLKIEDGRF